MPCDMQTQFTSIPFNSKGQGHLATFAKGNLVRIFWSKQLGQFALLIIILALLPCIYKISVSSYPKQISHCTLRVQESDQDLVVVL